MARTQVGGIRTVASREAAETGDAPDLAPPGLSAFKHVFQSRKSAFVVSLQRRRIHWMPDGSKEEEVPTSAAGNRLDMVRFTDHFYKTNDDELAAAFTKLPSEVFGLDGLCWRYEDQQKVMREARAAEIRSALAADPALLKEVTAFAPSDKKDWDQKPAVNRPAKVEDLTEEELEAQTAPPPGSRTR